MFLSSQCFFSELTDDLLSTSQPFSCGNEDLDDFFKNDATRYAYYLMGKSYCFRKNDDPTKIVCAFTVSNDSIRIYDLPRSRKDYMKSLTHHEKPLRRYPGILIGRLGVNKDFCGKGIGSEVIDFIKGWFMSHDKSLAAALLSLMQSMHQRLSLFMRRMDFSLCLLLKSKNSFIQAVRRGNL